MSESKVGCDTSPKPENLYEAIEGCLITFFISVFTCTQGSSALPENKITLIVLFDRVQHLCQLEISNSFGVVRNRGRTQTECAQSVGMVSVSGT